MRAAREQGLVSLYWQTQTGANGKGLFSRHAGAGDRTGEAAEYYDVSASTAVN